MCYLKQKLVNNDTLGALNWQKRDLEEKRHPKVPGEEAASLQIVHNLSSLDGI